MIFSDIKTLMRRSWSNTTYSDNLNSIHIISDDVSRITNDIFERLGIANKNMDGNSVIRLDRVDECERNNPVIYSEIFNNMVNGKFVSPAYYSAKITEACLENGIEDETLIYGYICRGLRTLASFFREMDLEDKLKSCLNNVETIRNVDLDISEHTDILIRYNRNEYRIWSYQDTDIGIRNGVSKLKGERGGEIPNGIHILCPLLKSAHYDWYGWWLYSQSTVNEIIQKINDGNADNYDEIINSNVDQYMKNVNIFIKGMKQVTGNIGEWSELYTLFKLLADGKLYAADENTNKIPEIYYDILKVLRSERNSNLEYSRESEVKVINAETGEMICSVPIKTFAEQTDKLLADMKSKNDTEGAFELPDTWQFASSIGCQSLKAKSQDKADIFLMVHDIMSGRDDTFGFSIKSQLGSPSTLFNASGATNFIYTVTEHILTQSEINTFNGLKKFKHKFDYLHSLGADIEFDDVDNKTFDFNLKMVTSEMPEIFAEMIKAYYEGKANKIFEITEIVAKSGIVNTIDNGIYLKHKVKTLLTNIALGMVPNTLWTGDYEATGGYIIVKEDGDVVCYHIYNRNAFMNYMFENTRFDTPSQSRHGFGKIYEENGWQFLKLNTQIRFVK